MSRYIDANLLLEELENSTPLNLTDSEREMQEQFDYQVFKNMIEYQPTADVAEVRHARWIEESSLYVHCSNCRAREYPREHHFKSKICPDCSARMDGERSENGN